MKVLLLKDWARHKKGEVIEIKDPTVIKKGLEIELFTDKIDAKPEEKPVSEAVKEPAIDKPKKSKK